MHLKDKQKKEKIREVIISDTTGNQEEKDREVLKTEIYIIFALIVQERMNQMVRRDFIPNGLLSNKATSVAKVLDRDRWSQVEARTAELLACIQPTITSEIHRNHVVSYLQHLLMRFIPCQVFTFGSVPLKTYLPDGDIDLTAFGDRENLKDSVIPEVLDILKNEENNKDAEFHVKEVQYIQAEVKIIKCLVENFVVDISFNQLGGLSTLCFFEEVDELINQNHLFKRSVILIKAWCFYESRILGSHHGLISTYALEILVLYIFHVYNIKFAGPLEVLYRFLDFFSSFDWDNYCLSLRGPVPKGSLPIMKAEPPRKDRQPLLLSESFLNACNSCYGVMPMPCSKENQENPFVSKYIDIVDPLRANNNLGRSISKGNFFRIRSAIAFGAQRLARLLDCSEDNLIAEFDFFFKNTWNRNGNGYWIDARTYNLYIRNNNVEKSTHHESEVEEEAQASHGISPKPDNHLKESKQMFATSDVSAVSQTLSSMTNDISTGTMTSDIVQTSSMKNAYSEVPTQPGNTRETEGESKQIHSTSSVTDNTMASSSRSEVLDKHNIRVSSENQHSVAVKSNDASDSYDGEFGSGVNYEDGYSVDEATWMHQEEHDINITETSRIPNSNDIQEPVSVNSSNVSSPPSPHGLASGYRHADSFGVLPVNIPSLESQNMPHSQDLVLFTEPVDPNVLVAHLDHERQMTANSVSSSVNSPCKTDSGSNSLKDDVEPTEQKCLTRENVSDDPPDVRTETTRENVSDDPPDAIMETTEQKGLTRENVRDDRPDLRMEATEQKGLTRENVRDDPPDVRTIDSNVMSSIASSSCTPARHSTSMTNLPSSSFSKGSFSKTSQPDDVSCQSTADTDMHESKTSETLASYLQSLHLGRNIQKLKPMSNSSVPDTPALVGPSSSQGAFDKQKRLLPFALDSPGTQFPFPFYNLPTETGTTYMDAELANLHARESRVILDPTQRLKQSNIFHVDHINHDATRDYLVKQRFDILNGDYASYWTNLQYGIICQNLESAGPLLYPSSAVPPRYLWGQFLWFKKATNYMNLMAHGAPLIPDMQSQSFYGLHAGVDQQISFWLPRFSAGTGTYLPNPISYHQRYYDKNIHDKDPIEYENYKYERERRSSRRARSSRRDRISGHDHFSSSGQFVYKATGKRGKKKASHQGESSHNAVNELANSERDHEQFLPRQPSKLNFLRALLH